MSVSRLGHCLLGRGEDSQYHKYVFPHYHMLLISQWGNQHIFLLHPGIKLFLPPVSSPWRHKADHFDVVMLVENKAWVCVIRWLSP